MNAKEFILSIPLPALTEEFMVYYVDEEKKPSVLEVSGALERLCREIDGIEPLLTKDSVAAKAYEPDGLDVFGLDENGTDHSLLFMKWAEVLGYTVPEELAVSIGSARLAAGLLYEMTWFGSTDEENNRAVEEFEEEIKQT